MIKMLSQNRVYHPIVSCCRETLPKAWTTAIWFLKIMFPVSFFVLILDYFGIMQYLSSYATPLFEWLGVPGSAALVLLTSILTNIYTVIALLASLDFTMRETVIMAVMCLISHNFVVETVVLKKTGSSALWMMVLRLTASIVMACILNWILPSMQGTMALSTVQKLSFSETFYRWMIDSAYLACKVIVIISVLMIIQRLLDRSGILKHLSLLLKPIMKSMGLPCNCAFLWLVGNTLGLAYGSAVMLDDTAQGKLTHRERDLLNHHLALSHSQLEDPLLFAAIGCPIGWLLFPRLLIAILVVWIVRLVYWIKDSRFDKIIVKEKSK